MGRKKSKARQKRVNAIDIQIKFPNDRSENTFNFASEPTLPSQKINFQSDGWFPILPNTKITSTLGTNKKGFPKLPILSNSMQKLGTTDAESSTSNWKVASCDNLPLTSNLTPLPSSLELRKLEADALRMDRYCSFRLDCIVFKDSVPCFLGNHLQDNMAKILNSLHPKTALSFRSKIHDLSHIIDHSISAYNSVCRMATVQIDVLTTMEFLLTEKMTRQRSQIEELENQVAKMTDLISETNAWASDMFEKQRTELNQKDKIIGSLEEEVNILKADKFREQSYKLDEKDKTIISFEEEISLKANRCRKLCSELDEKNTTIQHLEETANLDILRLDTEKTSESQKNLGIEVLRTPSENLIAERKSEAETEICEFDEILELGKCLSKNLLSIQKAKEMRSLQREKKCLNVAIDDQKISRQEVLVELNSLKSQNASLTKQLHSKKQILVSLDTELQSLRNEILVKSTKIEESEKKIENLNDDLERSNGMILSLQEENKALKQNLTQLDTKISNSKASCSLPEIPHLLQDRDRAIEVKNINLRKSNETQQVLQKTKQFLNSSQFPITNENTDGDSFEFRSSLMSLNNGLMQHPDNPKNNISAENFFQEDIQNLKHEIEIQQFSLKQQRSYVRKLAQEICSIKLQNSSLSERLSRNESKLALMISSESYDASMVKKPSIV